MPAEPCNAAGDLIEFVPRREIDEALDEIEADAAHAGRMHRLKLGIADAALDGGDPARLASGMNERVDHRAVVGAVTRRLHDHVARDAEMVAQRVELMLRRIARRVFPLRRVRKLRARTEHMAMRVNGAGRQLEPGLGWTGIPIEPSWGLLEWPSSRFRHKHVLSMFRQARVASCLGRRHTGSMP